MHRFLWLKDDNLIGEIKGNWNYLVGVNTDAKNIDKDNIKMLHWTLGGPWFKDQRNKGGNFSTAWFCARDEAMRLWE